jgi:hypothetical protein
MRSDFVVERGIPVILPFQQHTGARCNNLLDYQPVTDGVGYNTLDQAKAALKTLIALEVELGGPVDVADPRRRPRKWCVWWPSQNY